MTKPNLFLIVFAALIFSENVFAQSPTGGSFGQAAMADIITMFSNGANSFSALISLTQQLSVVIGIFLVINSVFKFAQVGTDPRTSIKMPLTTFFIGVALISLSSLVSVVGGSVALTSNPGDILLSGGSGFTSNITAAINGVLLFVRLIGYISFIRGWLLLNKYGNGDQNIGMGKPLIHIIGGVAAINSQLTATILRNTFSPNTQLPW